MIYRGYKTIYTLRIKKKYLDLIESGEKQIEYRADKPFYAKLATMTVPFMIRFHYQKKEGQIYRKAWKVERIKTPAFIPKDIISTAQCWAIHLTSK